jgi:hypothetical protein
MSRIYRTMKADEDNKPVVGRPSACLGVRVYTDGTNDIYPEEGKVAPKKGGMSVAPSLQTLNRFFVPRRLRHLVEGASGRDSHKVFRMGEGPFESAPVAPKLALRPESPTHGLVEPDAILALEVYEAALAATRDKWVIDETGE